MKTRYNIDNKSALAEPYLKGSIVPGAKRNQNFTHLGGRVQSHSLWRNLSYSSVLQKAETKVVFANLGKIPATFQSLSSRGTAGRRLSDNVTKRGLSKSLLARSETTKQSHNFLVNKGIATLPTVARNDKYDFLHFAKKFRNEKPKFPVFLRVSYLKYHFSRFFEVLHNPTSILSVTF